MRLQSGKLGLNGFVVSEVGTDQDTVPIPPAGFRWLDQKQHLTLEEVYGEATKHTFGKEGRVLTERLQDPLVFERFHVLHASDVIAGTPMLFRLSQNCTITPSVEAAWVDCRAKSRFPKLLERLKKNETGESNWKELPRAQGR